MTDIDAILQALTVQDVWQKLGLPNCPTKLKVVTYAPYRNNVNSPALSIYEDGRKWKDFAEGCGGSVIDFYMRCTGSGKGQAIRELAMMAGITEYDSHDLSRITNAKPKKKTTIHLPDEIDMTETISSHNPENLNRHAVIEWLASKGITEKTLDESIRRNEISCYKGNLCFLYPYGGIKVRPYLYDSHRCFWPAPCAIQGLWGSAGLNEYTGDRIWVTEGESDRLKLMQHVSDMVVAVPNAGFRLTQELAFHLGFYRDVVLCFDADKAGNDAFKQWKEMLLEHGPGGRTFRLEIPPEQDVCTCDLQKAIDKFYFDLTEPCDTSNMPF